MYQDIDSALLFFLPAFEYVSHSAAGNSRRKKKKKKKSKALDYLHKQKIAPGICGCAESTTFHLWFSIKEGYSSITNGPIEGKDNSVNAIVTSKTRVSKYPV